MAHQFSPGQQAELEAFFRTRLAQEAEVQRTALRTEMERDVGSRFEELRQGGVGIQQEFDRARARNVELEQQHQAAQAQMRLMTEQLLSSAALVAESRKKRVELQRQLVEAQRAAASTAAAGAGAAAPLPAEAGHMVE